MLIQCEQPWQVNASDTYHRKEKEYLMTVDHCSNFFEIDKLLKIDTKTVIGTLKKHEPIWSATSANIR